MKRYLDRRLKLHQLRVIEAIHAQTSLLKASKALGLTQPALTRSLHEIESLMGVRLFERHAKGVTATEAGRLVVESAARILADTRRLEAELDHLTDRVEGSVAVGALPAAAAGLVPGVIAKLQASHPLLRAKIVQGRTEELLPQLAQGDLDLVVGRLYEPEVKDGFVRTVLYEEPIAILARNDHPLFSLDHFEPGALNGFPVALPTTTQRVGREIEQFLGEAGIKPTDRLRSSSLPLIRELLLATDTVTVMPRLMLAGDLLRGAIRALPCQFDAPARPAGLIARADTTLNAGARAFVAALEGYLRDLAPEASEPQEMVGDER